MKKHIVAILPMGLYTFFYLVLELAINDYAEPVVGGANVARLYGFSYIAVAAGYPLYHFASKLNATGRRLSLAVAGGVCALGFILLSYTSSNTVFIICALSTHLAAGFMGGAIYSQAAMAWHGSANIGIYLGAAYAGSNLVQAVGLVLLSFVSIPAGRMLERIVLMVVLAVVVWMASFGGQESNTQPTTPSETIPAIRKYIRGAMAAMAVLALLHGVNDGIITSMHADGGEYIAYGYPRLLTIPACVFAGWVADIRSRKIFPYATFLSMIIMTAGILLFSTPATYNIATSFIYFFGCFMSLSSAVPFVVWAPATRRPALVAVAGRSVRYGFSGLAILVGGALYTTSLMVLLVIYVVLLAVLFSIYFFMGQLNTAGGEQPDPQQLFASRYSLTGREAEILALLYHGNSTEEIAEELFISGKTVRNHISNMLAKTGLHSRNELIALVNQAYTEHEVHNL